jgi:NAD(P)H-nitrite reductase large subunit
MLLEVRVAVYTSSIDLTDTTSTVAIHLEERYKGIRSPHKIKGGVSGCIRECAEAQSKDFGLIATDKGWNGTYSPLIVNPQT